MKTKQIGNRFTLQSDYSARLEHASKQRFMSKSAYIRQAVVQKLKEDGYIGN